MNQNNFNQMLAFVQKQHAGQVRNKDRQTPYWLHCYGVAMILRSAFDIHDMRNYGDIVLAGLGHDLYEDTEATEADVAALVGDKVAKLIGYLTNEVSDFDREAYMEKLRNAPEEAILVKMADMIDNQQSVFHNIDSLGLDWLNDFFMPIMDDSIEIIRGYDNFDTYATVGRYLKKSVEVQYRLLKDIQNRGLSC